MGSGFASHNAGRSRATSAALVAGLHVGVFLAVLLIVQPRAAPGGPAIASFDIAAAATPVVHRAALPQPRHINLPSPTVVASPDVAVTNDDQITRLLQQADAASGGCDLTGPVQAALRSDANVQAQLPTIPVSQRSVANAVAVWNQNWTVGKSNDDASLSDQSVYRAIRDSVARTVAAATPACRAQPQAGPRLIYLPDGNPAGGTTGSSADVTPGSTMVLALGSGTWTWQQVADTAPERLALNAGWAPALTGAFQPAAFLRDIPHWGSFGPRHDP